jgi:hypothetical protein
LAKATVWFFGGAVDAHCRTTRTTFTVLIYRALVAFTFEYVLFSWEIVARAVVGLAVAVSVEAVFPVANRQSGWYEGAAAIAVLCHIICWVAFIGEYNTWGRLNVTAVFRMAASPAVYSVIG